MANARDLRQLQYILRNEARGTKVGYRGRTDRLQPTEQVRTPTDILEGMKELGEGVHKLRMTKEKEDIKWSSALGRSLAFQDANQDILKGKGKGAFGQGHLEEAYFRAMGERGAGTWEPKAQQIAQQLGNTAEMTQDEALKYIKEQRDAWLNSQPWGSNPIARESFSLEENKYVGQKERAFRYVHNRVLQSSIAAAQSAETTSIFMEATDPSGESKLENPLLISDDGTEVRDQHGAALVHPGPVLRANPLAYPAVAQGIVKDQEAQDNFNTLVQNISNKSPSPWGLHTRASMIKGFDGFLKIQQTRLKTAYKAGESPSIISDIIDRIDTAFELIKGVKIEGRPIWTKDTYGIAQIHELELLNEGIATQLREDNTSDPDDIVASVSQNPKVMELIAGNSDPRVLVRALKALKNEDGTPRWSDMKAIEEAANFLTRNYSNPAELTTQEIANATSDTSDLIRSATTTADLADAQNQWALYAVKDQATQDAMAKRFGSKAEALILSNSDEAKALTNQLIGVLAATAYSQSLKDLPIGDKRNNLEKSLAESGGIDYVTGGTGKSGTNQAANIARLDSLTKFQRIASTARIQETISSHFDAYLIRLNEGDPDSPLRKDWNPDLVLHKDLLSNFFGDTAELRGLEAAIRKYPLNTYYGDTGDLVLPVDPRAPTTVISSDGTEIFKGPSNYNILDSLNRLIGEATPPISDEVSPPTQAVPDKETSGHNISYLVNELDLLNSRVASPDSDDNAVRQYTTSTIEHILSLRKEGRNLSIRAVWNGYNRILDQLQDSSLSSLNRRAAEAGAELWRNSLINLQGSGVTDVENTVIPVFPLTSINRYTAETKDFRVYGGSVIGPDGESIPRDKATSIGNIERDHAEYLSWLTHDRSTFDSLSDNAKFVIVRGGNTGKNYFTRMHSLLQKQGINESSISEEIERLKNKQVSLLDYPIARSMPSRNVAQVGILPKFRGFRNERDLELGRSRIIPTSAISPDNIILGFDKQQNRSEYPYAKNLESLLSIPRFLMVEIDPATLKKLSDKPEGHQVILDQWNKGQGAPQPWLAEYGWVIQDENGVLLSRETIRKNWKKVFDREVDKLKLIDPEWTPENIEFPHRLQSKDYPDLSVVRTLAEIDPIGWIQWMNRGVGTIAKIGSNAYMGMVNQALESPKDRAKRIKEDKRLEDERLRRAMLRASIAISPPQLGPKVMTNGTE